MPIVASYYRARYHDPSAGRFVLEETAYSGKVIEVERNRWQKRDLHPVADWERGREAALCA